MVVTNMKNLAIEKIKRTVAAMLIVATTFVGCFATAPMNAYAASNDYILDQNAREDIVNRALSWVGKAEYVWGACSPGAFDCSGFVSYCVTGTYKRIGTTYTFLGWPQTNDPQPGDICINSGHCGIYVGGGQMVHAVSEGLGVDFGPIQNGMIYVRCPY